MSLTEEWFAAGKLSAAQVRLLRSAFEAKPEAFERDEQMLLEQSTVLWHDHFARAIKHWIYVNNEDEEDRKARERYKDRSLRVVDCWNDMVDINGSLDVVNGAIFKDELKRIESRMFEQDWREAEARLGRKPALHELARTANQRRADALVEMARRSYALADGTPRPRPLITVVIDHPTVKRLCQLADGTFVTPGEVLPLFCDCDIERVVFGADSRVLDVGQKQRFFTGATRRAVEIRDLQCTRPSCDVPYEDCEIDHVQPWAVGGATSQANGRCACRHDNRSRPRSQLGGDGDDDTADW